MLGPDDLAMIYRPFWTACCFSPGACLCNAPTARKCGLTNSKCVLSVWFLSMLKWARELLELLLRLEASLLGPGAWP
jgi:hypothetical protein